MTASSPGASSGAVSPSSDEDSPSAGTVSPSSGAVAILAAALARAQAAPPAEGGFPRLAEILRQAGVRGYVVDVPSGSSVYLLDAGDVHRPGHPPAPGSEAGEPQVLPRFDRDALIAALRANQEGRSTYPEFLRASLHAGVLRYEVDTAARTCTYQGARGERYVESYPAVEVPEPQSRPS